MECLLEALSEWNRLAEELRQLGERQLDAILSPKTEDSLHSILARKEQAYRATQALCRRVVELEEEFPAPTPGSAAWTEGWAETGRLRDRLMETLAQLADLEAQSQSEMSVQLQKKRAELERVQKTRSASHLYYGGAIQNGGPRFLDQKR